MKKHRFPICEYCIQAFADRKALRIHQTKCNKMTKQQIEKTKQEFNQKRQPIFIKYTKP